MNIFKTIKTNFDPKQFKLYQLMAKYYWSRVQTMIT